MVEREQWNWHVDGRLNDHWIGSETDLFIKYKTGLCRQTWDGTSCPLRIKQRDIPTIIFNQYHTICILSELYNMWIHYYTLTVVIYIRTFIHWNLFCNFVKNDKFNGSKMSGHHWLDMINCSEHFYNVVFLYWLHGPRNRNKTDFFPKKIRWLLYNCMEKSLQVLKRWPEAVYWRRQKKMYKKAKSGR